MGKNMVLSQLLRIFIVFLSVTIVACTTQIEESSSDDDDYNRDRFQTETYTIGVDDQLKVTVWGNAELSQEMPVRPDGKISMPLIGDVQAGGLVPEAVAADIKKKLSRYVKKPNVTVSLTQLRSHEYISRIRVTGAVQTPISIPFRQGMTLLDAVLAAGGITEFAAPSRAKLHRQRDGKTKTYNIDLDAILNDGDLSTNKRLLPGDIIAIPERYL